MAWLGSEEKNSWTDRAMTGPTPSTAASSSSVAAMMASRLAQVAGQGLAARPADVADVEPHQQVGEGSGLGRLDGGPQVVDRDGPEPLQFQEGVDVQWRRCHRRRG